MVDLRRIFLLLAAVALVSTLAFGQINPVSPVTCNVQAAVPTIIRDVANADQSGDVVLECTGGIPTAYNQYIPLVNIQVFYTAPVTSNVLTTKNGQQKLESILIFDELTNPGDNSARLRTPCPQNSTYDSTLDRCNVRSSGNPVESYLGQPVANTGDKPNIFQAVSVPGATSSDKTYSIAFYGVPFDPPGTLTRRILRISNVRLQSGGFASGGGIPAPIVASVSIQSPQAISIQQNTANVAYVQKTMSFSTEGQRDFLQCESETGTCPSFKVKFTELQPSAFKIKNKNVTPSSITGAYGDYQDSPNQVLYTEDMFTSATFEDTDLEGAGIASYGTRLLARFENVPLGVTLYATVYSEGYNTSTADGIAKGVLVKPGSSLTYNGNGSSIGASSTKTVSEDCDYWDNTSSYRGLAAINTGTQGGKNAAWAVWEITDAVSNLTQEISFGIVVNYTSDTANDRPEVRDDTTVKGHLAPLDPTGVPSATAPEPRHNETSNADQSGLFRIVRCRTNLLWPFVAQVGIGNGKTPDPSFDTGIAIANTSHDPFDYTATTKPHPRAQKGACTIYFYGTTGVSDPPPAAARTPEIPAGKVYAFSLYGGSADGAIPPAKDFVGYIIAVCDFQYGHGYGFISNVGAGAYAQGYVALVMDADMYDPAKGSAGARITRTRNYSEFLDQ